MSTDRDITRVVRSWLEEGSAQLPDRVLDAVLDQLPTTPQRRPSWLARRFPEMNTSAKIAIAAAAVVIFAILGVRFLAPAGLNIGGPAETLTPTPAPSPMALPASLTDLEAGTYGLDDEWSGSGPEPMFPFLVTFDVPEGWFSCSPGPHEIGACTPAASDPDAIMGFAFVSVYNVVADPCDRSFPQLDPPVGPSVDDLVTAISNLQGFTATDATDVTVDGFRGKQFEVTAPDGDGGCPDDGDSGFGTWTTPSRTNGVGPGEVNLLRILDVDGFRLVITAAYDPATASAEEVAEIHSVVESIHITP